MAVREGEWGKLYRPCEQCHHRGGKAYLGDSAPCEWDERRGPIVRIGQHPPLYQCPRKWLEPWREATGYVLRLRRHWVHGAVPRHLMTDACADSLSAVEYETEAWQAEVDAEAAKEAKRWQSKHN